MAAESLFDDEKTVSEALTAIGYCGSWRADYRSNLVWMSPEAKIKFSLPANNRPVKSEVVYISIHPDDRDWLRERRNKPNAAGLVRSIVEFRLCPSHEAPWIQSHSSRYIEADGTPIIGWGMNFDVTAIKMTGDGVSRNLRAPLPDPLNSLAEGIMLAMSAAEQLGNADLSKRLREISHEAARMLINRVMPWRQALRGAGD